jgi:hypothetical protein
MSESLFPFDTLDEPVGAEPPAAGNNRRALLLLGGGLAVAVGAAAAVFLGGGSSSDDTMVLPSAASAAAPQPVAPAAPSPSATTVPERNTESFARNPFKAQYVEPPPPPEPASVPSPVSVSVPLPSETPLDLSLGGPPTAPLPGGNQATPAPAPTSAEYPITLESVGEPRGEVRLVTWTIDGKEVETVPGQRFGRHGELVVLAYTTADGKQDITGVLIQVGDASPVAVALEETIKVL